MKPIVELKLQMRELRERLGISPQDLEAQTRSEVTVEHIKQFEDDTWLEVSRAELLTLLSLAQSVSTEAEPFEFISVRPHPLWTTFAEGARAIVFRGRGPANEELYEDHDIVAGLLRDTGLKPVDATVRAGDREDVGTLLHRYNTIFAGSPKHNEHAETALAQMLGKIRPFDSTPRNRAVAPFQFYWNNWDQLQAQRQRSSAFCDQATKSKPHGVTIRTASGKEFHLPTTPRFEDAIKGWDIGVLVAKRFAIDKKKAVTAIVLAGHSGFATSMMVRDITRGNLYLGKGALNAPYFMRFVLCAWKRKGKDHFAPFARSRRWFSPKDAEEIQSRIQTPPSSSGTGRYSRKPRSARSKEEESELPD